MLKESLIRSLLLYLLMIRLKQIIWSLFGKTIRRRAIAPLWRRFLLTLEMARRGYPDWLPTIVDEARQEFIEGKYFSSVIVSSSAVEWVLISELKRAGKSSRGGLSTRIDSARDLGLPVDELFDRNEAGLSKDSAFVRRRHAVAHGDIHGIPHREGLIQFKLPFETLLPVLSPVDADDAFDQLSKGLRFLIKWRVRTIKDRNMKKVNSSSIV